MCSMIILGKQSRFCMNTEHQGSKSQRNISEGVSSKGVSCYCCIFRPMNISKPLQKEMFVWNLKQICQNLWLLTKNNYWTQKLGSTTPNCSQYLFSITTCRFFSGVCWVLGESGKTQKCSRGDRKFHKSPAKLLWTIYDFEPGSRSSIFKRSFLGIEIQESLWKQQNPLSCICILLKQSALLLSSQSASAQTFRRCLNYFLTGILVFFFS